MTRESPLKATWITLTYYNLAQTRPGNPVPLVIENAGPYPSLEAALADSPGFHETTAEEYAAYTEHWSRDEDPGDLGEVPPHRNDLGDYCPRGGERTADGTCPVYCHEADVLAGFDAGERELPDSTGQPADLWPAGWHPAT